MLTAAAAATAVFVPVGAPPAGERRRRTRTSCESDGGAARGRVPALGEGQRESNRSRDGCPGRGSKEAEDDVVRGGRDRRRGNVDVGRIRLAVERRDWRGVVNAVIGDDAARRLLRQGNAQAAVSSSVKAKFVAATSVAVAVFRNTSWASTVVLLRRSTDVQPAGAQMIAFVPLRTVTWAIIWSSTARPTGFVIVSVVPPPPLFAAEELAERDRRRVDDVRECELAIVERERQPPGAVAVLDPPGGACPD